MDPNTQENIIKDLMYEQAAREILAQSTHAKRKRWLGLRIAAALAFILLSWLLFQDLIKKPLAQSGPQWADNHYEFPVVQKSRSAEQHISDALVGLLQNKEYEKALLQLGDTELSEKDRFVKAHLLYVTGDYDGAERLLAQPWTDEYYDDEAKWLRFLIGLKTKKSDPEIRRLFDALPDSYRDKAAPYFDRNGE